MRGSDGEKNPTNPDFAVASAPTRVGGLVSVRLSREIAGCRSSQALLGRITLKVQRDGRPVTLTVTADGTDATVSHVGAALLADTADRLGLTRSLSRELAGLRQRRSAHDPGRVVRDLAVMLADERRRA